MYKLLFPSLFVQFLTLTFIHANSPYAVHQVGTQAGGSQIGLYGYDTAGNRRSKTVADKATRNQTIAYGLIGKTVKISQGSFTSSIKHGPGGRRYLRANNDGSKTFYLPGMDYKIDADGATSTIRINAKGYSSVAQVDIISDSVSTGYTYFVQDHLGSLVVSVDDDGTVNKRNRYDAWGQMTEATGVAYTPTVDNDEKNRGYTGHEMMAKFNMGQWNGRIFDYEIGAFPQADMFIQGRSIAALNRYALGQHNNPNVVDPSGWMPESELARVFRLRREGRSIREATGGVGAETMRASVASHSSSLSEASIVSDATVQAGTRRNTVQESLSVGTTKSPQSLFVPESDGLGSINLVSSSLAAREPGLISLKHETPTAGDYFFTEAEIDAQGRILAGRNTADSISVGGFEYSINENGVPRIKKEGIDVFFDFVVSPETPRKLRLGHRHMHLASGQDVPAVGRIAINNEGFATRINNATGHYLTNEKEFSQFKSIFDNLGVRSFNENYEYIDFYNAP